MEETIWTDYDLALAQIGECGAWQAGLFLLLCLPAGLAATAIFSFEFAAFTPAHNCVSMEMSNHSCQVLNISIFSAK